MYAQLVKPKGGISPKYGWFLAAWAFVCTSRSAPEPGMREISMEEWAATPADYLVNPDMHPKFLAKFPGESTVENKREQLFSKHGTKDHDPSHPAAGGHGHH